MTQQFHSWVYKKIQTPTKNTNSKGYLYPSVHSRALFTLAKIWEEPKYTSTNEWIKVLCIYIYIHTMEYYSVIRKE